MFTDQIQARASVRIYQERVYGYDQAKSLWVRKQVGEVEVAHNLVTLVGRAQLAAFGYGTASRASGFNYVALTNNASAPANTDTALTGELTTDGLARSQGTVVLPVSPSNIVTITKVFTFTGATQSVQKTALFDQSSGGVMNHEIQFTQRNLVTNDTLTLVFNITVT